MDFRFFRNFLCISLYSHRISFVKTPCLDSMKMCPKIRQKNQHTFWVWETPSVHSQGEIMKCDYQTSHATCHMPHATCHMLHATCHVPHASCYILQAICHMPHAICHMPHATCYMLHATCYH